MKTIKILITGLYFSLLIHVAFFTSQRQIFKFTDAHSYLNLVPIINKIKEFQQFKTSDHKERINYIFNLVGNIILFIPFSVIMFFGFNITKRSTAIMIAFFLSILIELMQFISGLGVTDIDDVLLNVAGAILGSFIVKNIIDKGKRPVSV